MKRSIDPAAETFDLVSEGLASQAKVDRVAAELIALADDETTLFGFPLLAQVWGVR